MPGGLKRRPPRGQPAILGQDLPGDKGAGGPNDLLRPTSTGAIAASSDPVVVTLKARNARGARSKRPVPLPSPAQIRRQGIPQLRNTSKIARHLNPEWTAGN